MLVSATWLLPSVLLRAGLVVTLWWLSATCPAPRVSFGDEEEDFLGDSRGPHFTCSWAHGGVAHRGVGRTADSPRWSLAVFHHRSWSFRVLAPPSCWALHVQDKLTHPTPPSLPLLTGKCSDSDPRGRGLAVGEGKPGSANEAGGGRGRAPGPHLSTSAELPYPEQRPEPLSTR